MQLLSKSKIISEMNKWGSQKHPFLFIIDFKGENGFLIPHQEIHHSSILISFPNFVHQPETIQNNDFTNFELKPNPISKEIYLTQFEKVQEEIKYGNSYLLNLTFATPIGKNLPLSSIYHQAKASYKLLIENQFLCYSPETFIKIQQDKIFSYPMKGTIDASISDAETQLLNNKKELYEHFTIVDLIRNDLAIVSTQVVVTKFRYCEKIVTQKGAILQTSSEIAGQLTSDWNQKLGDIIFSLLPAGSISGAPKIKTMEIITEYELTDRGFYTGIAGYFDGQSLDSCVMIRFIHQDEEGNCYYHSGGGITSLSQGNEEYHELISKIYVPVS